MTIAMPERTRQDLVRLQDRAAAHALAGETDAAAALYREALSLRDDPTVWRSLGRLELQRGRLDEAERCFRRAGSHGWLAHTLERQDRLELAWHEAGKARPSPATARLRARLAARLGFYRRGVEILAPHRDAGSAFLRARLLDRLGEHREAWLTAVQANLAGDPPAPPPAPTALGEPDPDRRPVLVTGPPCTGAEILASLLNRHPELLALVVDPRRLQAALARHPDAAVVHTTRDAEATALSCFFRPLADWPADWTALRAELAAVPTADHRLPPPVRWEELTAEPERILRLTLARLGRPWDERCLAAAGPALERALADEPTGGAAAYARFFRPLETAAAPAAKGSASA